MYNKNNIKSQYITKMYILNHSNWKLYIRTCIWKRECRIKNNKTKKSKTNKYKFKMVIKPKRGQEVHLRGDIAEWMKWVRWDFHMALLPALQYTSTLGYMKFLKTLGGLFSFRKKINYRPIRCAFYKINITQSKSLLF